MLSDIGLQARNKIEKHDHKPRDAATMLAERLTPDEQSALAGEPDATTFKKLLAKAQLRLAEADVAAARAAAGETEGQLRGSLVVPSETIPPAGETIPPVQETGDGTAQALDDTDVE